MAEEFNPVEQIKELTTAFEELKSQRVTLSEEAQKKIDEALAKIEAKQEELEGMVKAQESMSLPGLEIGKEGEKGKFSYTRFARCVGDHTGKNWDRKENGVESDMVKHMAESDFAQKFAMNVGSDNAGGVLVSMEVQRDIIPDLEAEAIAPSAGVRQLYGLTPGSIVWPIDKGGILANYLNTEEEELGDETKMTFGQVETRPRPMAAFVPFTWGMLNLPEMEVEAIVRRKIVQKIALREDLSTFLGRGTNGEPRGIYHVPGVNTFDWSTLDGSHPDYGRGDATSQNITIALRSMAKAVEKSNALTNSSSAAFVSSVDQHYAMANTIDNEGREIFTSAQAGVPMGFVDYPSYRTTQVDADNTDTQVAAAITAAGITSSKEFLVFGDWGECINPHWGTFAFATSGETEENFRKGRVTLRAISSHDFACLQPKAFCIGQNVISSESA